MQLIRITSIQAPNADFTCRQIARYLATRLAIATEFIADIPWPERKRLLLAGDIHVGWMCGLPYVREADRAQPRFELLAAPVMRDPRYQNRPVYFSDVVVLRASAYHTFADLRVCRFARRDVGLQ